MFTLDDARDLARTAHAGQVDKQGRNYFDAHLTPIGEALLCFEDEAEHTGRRPVLATHLAMAGYLHDILEDTATTVADLSDAGVPAAVISAVVSVTRLSLPSGRHEPYTDLIERACGDPLGRWVKIADNRWNAKGLPDLARTDPETAARLKTKYDSAIATLIEGFDEADWDNLDRINTSLHQSHGAIASSGTVTP